MSERYQGGLMTQEILRELKEGALDALRLFVALISAPFVIAKEFMMRPPGEPFHWPRESGHDARDG
jgi:hypothetical protein